MVDDRCVFSTKRVNVSECACVVGSLDFEPCNYSSVTCISFSFKMAFVLRRAFSTSSRRLYYQTLKPTTANPAPVGGGAVLESPELQQLAQKARGSWKELSKEEIVQRKLKTSRHACTHSCLLSRVLFERLNRGLFYLMPTPIYKQHTHTHNSVQSFFPRDLQWDQKRPRRLQNCVTSCYWNGPLCYLAGRLSQKDRYCI